MWLTVLLLLVLAGVVGFLGRDGLWNNLLVLVNVILAALLATNFFEPAARAMEGISKGGTFLWDFAAVWLLFAVIFTVLRLATDWLSRKKVRFIKPVDLAGGWFFALWTGWVMVCFTTMTLHTAPLARNFLGGAFQPEESMFFGLAPDRQWLGFVRMLSVGSYSSGRPFDERGDFMPRYATRREDFARVEGIFVETDKIQLADRVETTADPTDKRDTPAPNTSTNTNNGTNTNTPTPPMPMLPAEPTEPVDPSKWTQDYLAFRANLKGTKSEKGWSLDWGVMKNLQSISKLEKLEQEKPLKAIKLTWKLMYEGGQEIQNHRLPLKVQFPLRAPFAMQVFVPDRDLAAWVRSIGGAADKTFTVDLRITEIQTAADTGDVLILIETTSPPRNIINEL